MKQVLVFWGSYWQFRLGGFKIRFLISVKEIYETIVNNDETIARKINKLGFQTVCALNIQYLFTTVFCIFL